MLGMSESMSWKIFTLILGNSFVVDLSPLEFGNCCFCGCGTSSFCQHFWQALEKRKKLSSAPFSLFIAPLPISHCVGTASGHEHSSVWPWLFVKLHITHSPDTQYKTRSRKQGGSLAGR